MKRRGLNITEAAKASELPAGQQRTVEGALKGNKHPSARAYQDEKCRCVPCVEAWNRRYRVRGRAVQRLINAHRDEFETYRSEEMAHDAETWPWVAE